MRAGENKQPLKVILANPRGFCAGVERAIETVECALARFGAPVYVRHEIVHNRRVVDELASRGAVFVERVEDVPFGAVTVFSAHGVSRKVAREAVACGLHVIDATCPLVAKVHKEGQRYAAMGCEVILIGHAGHPEVIGTLGQIPGPVHVIADAASVRNLPIAADADVAYVTQTTLSILDTRDIITAICQRWPNALGPDTRDICYATQNRQQAVLDMAAEIDLLLVVGATNSSNSNRLREIGAQRGIASHLVGSARDIRSSWLEAAGAIGVTAGASAPEILVREVIARIARHREIEIEERAGVREDIAFRLPRELDEIAPAGAQMSA